MVLQRFAVKKEVQGKALQPHNNAVVVLHKMPRLRNTATVSKCTCELFHLKCLNLKLFPRTSKWYCPQ